MITKIESGVRKLNTYTIDKICNLFCCSKEYLLGTEDDTYTPLDFCLKKKDIQKEDLDSIAAVNKIVLNIRYMNNKVSMK